MPSRPLLDILNTFHIPVTVVTSTGCAGMYVSWGEDTCCALKLRRINGVELRWSLQFPEAPGVRCGKSDQKISMENNGTAQ